MMRIRLARTWSLIAHGCDKAYRRANETDASPGDKAPRRSIFKANGKTSREQTDRNEDQPRERENRAVS